MKIETIKDPNIFNHDFKAPWLNKISYEEWCKFLAHNYAYGREEAYHIVRDYVGNKNKKLFLEIGFGNGYDFEHCFQYLHEMGHIIYKGWEITEQFVKYARKKFYHQDFCFSLGGFGGLIDFNDSFDITYTRHTLEHQHPYDGYNCFTNMLRATRELAIVTWFKPPKVEKFTWNDRDGGNKGAYVNAYSKEKLFEIIEKNKFKLNIIDIQYKKNINQIWEMRKHND